MCFYCFFLILQCKIGIYPRKDKQNTDKSIKTNKIYSLICNNSHIVYKKEVECEKQKDKKRKIYENHDANEDAPAVRLIATLSLVNVAWPRLIVAGRQVNMPAAW